MISISREFDTDIITLFHATGDFNHRHRWQEGVQRMEEIDHLLPRVGMKCRCIKDNGETVIYSSSYSFHPEHIEFSETDEQDNSITYYALDKLGPMKTSLTINYYRKKSLLGNLFFGKKKVEAMYERSIRNLDALVKEIQLPVK